MTDKILPRTFILLTIYRSLPLLDFNSVNTSVQVQKHSFLITGFDYIYIPAGHMPENMRHGRTTDPSGAFLGEPSTGLKKTV
jgi:hypothetical protein